MEKSIRDKLNEMFTPCCTYAYQIAKDNFGVTNFVIYPDMFYYTRYNKIRIVVYMSNDVSLHDVFELNGVEFSIDVLNNKEFTAKEKMAFEYSDILGIGYASSQEYYDKLTDFSPRENLESFVNTVINEQEEILNEYKAEQDEEKKKHLTSVFLLRGETVCDFLSGHVESFVNSLDKITKLDMDEVFELVESEKAEEIKSSTYQTMLEKMEESITMEKSLLKLYLEKYDSTQEEDEAL